MRLLALLALFYQQVPDVARLPRFLSPDIPWSGYAHDPQHTAVSANGAQNLNSIHWQTPVDLNPHQPGKAIFISTTDPPW